MGASLSAGGASAGSPLHVPLSPSLRLSRPHGAPAPCPACAAVQGLRCRGRAAPLAGQLRGWRRVPLAGVRTLGRFTESALALCVPAAGGKGSSPQHPRREQLSFIPEQVPRGPGNALPAVPLLVLHASRSGAVLSEAVGGG